MSILDYYEDLPRFFRDLTNLTIFPKELEALKTVMELEHNWRENIGKEIVLSAGRGTGKTTFDSVIALWYTVVVSQKFNESIHVLLLAGSLDQTRTLFDYCLKYAKSPLIKPYYDSSTETEIRFKNGSKIERIPRTSFAIEGKHPNVLIFDETANEKISDKDVLTALQSITGRPHQRAIFSSTPYYYHSLFCDYYRRAKQYGFITFNWSKQDCHWISDKDIERDRRLLNENSALWKIQVLGEPSIADSEAWIPLKDLKECVVEPQDLEPFLSKELRARYVGVDLGFSEYSKTCITVAEMCTDNKLRVCESRAYDFKETEELYSELMRIIAQYQPLEINIDASSGHQIVVESFLKEHPELSHIIKPIHFQKHTREIYNNLRMWIVSHKLLWSNRNQDLTQDVRDFSQKYKESSEIKTSKVRYDFVDSLALTVVNIVPLEGIQKPVVEEEDKNLDLEAILKEMVVRRKSKSYNARTRVEDWDRWVEGVR